MIEGNHHTAREIVLDFIRSRNGWVKSWEIVKAQLPLGWVGNSGDRIARYLVQDGLLERKCEKHTAMYRIRKKQTELF